MEFLQSRSVHHSANQRERSNKLFIFCNDYGAIFTIYENHSVMRKSNMTSHADLRIRSPLEIINEASNSNLPKISITIVDDCKVSLMYCHRVCENIDSSTRRLMLLGPACIYLKENIINDSEDWQLTHAKSCSICPLCQAPKTLDLIDGDKLILKTGRFFIRISSYKHCIYMTRKQYKNHVVYKSKEESMDSFKSLINSF